MPLSPRRPQGPHLNALRAFEAAARLGGFAAAADELSVTPGAVSQQIKALEDWVGASLFRRKSHGVTLTDLGAKVTHDLTEAFDIVGHSVHTLRAASGRGTIRFAALPSVAQLWLSPRLPTIRRALPNQTVSVTAMETSPNLRREVFDLSVFIAEDHGTGRVIEQDSIFPVCTPELAKKVTKPEDLAHQTLLHDATWLDDWRHWFNETGYIPDTFDDGPVFSLYAMAVDEARNGAGFLMGHAALVERDLQDKTLVAPFAERVPTGKALVIESAIPNDPRLTTLVNLLTR